MKFAIHIATRNRLEDLSATLESLGPFAHKAEIIVYDDGSTDGTSAYLARHFPNIAVYRNETPMGYLHCRNKMLNQTSADIAISLDDDSNFLSPEPLVAIERFFTENPACGLIAFRIFWGKEAPGQTGSSDSPGQVRAFVGCGHAWRVAAWREIPDYPEWFEFYGEEKFSALQLHRKGWAVHYLPSVLVHHRVDMKARRAQADFLRRYRRSVRADWYIFFLFYPTGTVYRKMAYSLKNQIFTKVLRGQPKLLLPIVGALWDLMRNFRNIRRGRSVLSKEKYDSFMALAPTKIYWKPEASN